MSQFSIKLYKAKYKKLWDDFIPKAKNATFLFYRDFMEYHQERFDDFSLIILKDKKVVALLPANRLYDEVYSHQGLTYGSIILSSSIKLFDSAQVLIEILKFLNANNIKRLYLKEIPSIYCTSPSDELQYLLFILKAKLERRDTLSVVSLSSRLKVSKDRLSGDKRAKKHDLKITEEQTFDIFWKDILIPNLIDKHSVKPVHSLQEIKSLKERFPKNIRQFNVYHNNKIIAGTTIFETTQVAHSQYISGNKDKNILGSLDFLHMHLINNVFINKAYFDFGISNENNGLNINKGLLYWKEGFGARSVTQDFYSIDIANYKLLDKVWI